MRDMSLIRVIGIVLFLEYLWSGNHKAKTGEEIYNWARGSVTSRFSETGKIVLLSFPRFKDDFIQQKYNEVVDDKEVIERRATIKANPNPPVDIVTGKQIGRAHV